MILRDNSTPRGRLVTIPPRMDWLYNLKSHVGVLPEGQTVRDTINRMFRDLPREPRPRRFIAPSTVTLTCTVCLVEYECRRDHMTLSKTCSTRCRSKAYRTRKS